MEEELKNKNSSSLDIDSIYKKEEEMLYSIYDFISDKYRDIISKKINLEKGILNNISNKEKDVEEKYEREKNEIDQNFFDKRSLNINNL